MNEWREGEKEECKLSEQATLLSLICIGYPMAI